ncbi:MAG: YaeQ family protein [Pseudomonadales bacterium]|nr:YaeQ family protein [Pseudomonadales bacterium]
MALKASIFKAAVNISDLNRELYQDFNLTLARHPSETDERMMMRLLAFVLNAAERLEFGRGLSSDDEPDVWLKSLSGEIELWLDVGLPSYERCRKASGQSQSVKLYVYGAEKNVKPWWKKTEADFARLKKLQILKICGDDSSALADLAQVNMQLQFTLDGDDIYINAGDVSLHITISSLKDADNRGW